MVPNTVRSYLQAHSVPYTAYHHLRAASEQALRDAMALPGYPVARGLPITVDDHPALLVLPAEKRPTEQQLTQALHARQVRRLPMEALRELMPGCERGAEPPLGSSRRWPVFLDAALAKVDGLIVRGGTSQDSLEFKLPDFLSLEKPHIVALDATYEH